MEVILIFNGLGNQMSQYAFYLAKKRQCKHCIPFFIPISHNRHNGSELDKLFHISYPNYFIRLLIRLIYSSCMRLRITSNKFVSIIREPKEYTYTPSFLSKGKSWINFYYGGWHCEEYFKNIKKEVDETFEFDVANEKDNKFNLWKKTILDSDNSVSVHIRRGDFLIPPSDGFYQFQGVATLEYYQQSITYIRKMRENCDFFVFSDDLEWCKNQFGDQGFYYVDGNKKDKSWRDLYLMSICKDHINANSTFSWWGAWLSKNKEGFILHPKEFIYGVNIKDFYPKNWIEIS